MKKDYYIYAYLDPEKPGEYDYVGYNFEAEPFYIGKGQNYRGFMHVITAYRTKAGNLNKEFYSRIKGLISRGQFPVVKIIRHSLSESRAFDIETFLVRAIGRADLKKGPLLNLTDGGAGARKISVTRARPIRVFSLQGKFIKDYPSVCVASEDLKITPSVITRQCKERFRTHTKLDYQFRYVETGLIEVAPAKTTWAARGRKLQQLSMENTLIREWKSAKEVERVLGYSRFEISKATRDIINDYAGFKWKYV